MKVYPNPATNIISIENVTDGEITVLNVNGATVVRGQVKGGKAAIDVSKLPAGMYIVRSADAASRFVKLSSE